MAPAVGSTWRCRWAPKRIVQVTGAQDDRILSLTLTDDTGGTPVVEMTNSTVLTEWGWMYELAGLGART